MVKQYHIDLSIDLVVVLLISFKKGEDVLCLKFKHIFALDYFMIPYLAEVVNRECFI